MRIDEGRIYGNRAFVICHRLFQGTLSIIKDTQIIVSLIVVGEYLDGLFIFADGFLQLPQILIGPPETPMGNTAVWRSDYRF